MDDLISRQAVMDAIEAEKLKRGDYLASSFVGFETAEDVVRGLPSAQPEIIRCGECVHHVDNFFCRKANHHTSNGDDCMSVFGAERRTDEQTD